MVWLYPAAFALLAAAAAPVLIHLLLRRRAVRRPFPSLRFIAPSRQSSVRLRWPSDLPLLLVRVAIVACAALAIARPLLLTDARHERWLSRITRAVVVDTSPSVSREAAQEAASAQLSGAASARTFESPQPADGVRSAAAWLARAESGAREIVVISDFQRGQLTASDVRTIAKDIGLEFVRVGGRVVTEGKSAPAPQVWYDGRTYARTVTVDDTATHVTLQDEPNRGGLEIQGTADGGGRVAQAIAAGGAIAPAPGQRILVRVGAAPLVQRSAAWAASWTKDTAFRLLSSPDLEDVDVRPSTQNGVLVLDVNAPPDSIAPAQVAHAALNARHDVRTLAEYEPARVSDEALNAWTRPPGPPGETAWWRTTESDGRWLWVLVLALLGVETLLRRERPSVVSHEESRAA